MSSKDRRRAEAWIGAGLVRPAPPFAPLYGPRSKPTCGSHRVPDNDRWSARQLNHAGAGLRLIVRIASATARATLPSPISVSSTSSASAIKHRYLARSAYGT